MPVSHSHLIKLIQSLNLGDAEGICAGITEMGINAFLSDQFKQYIDRFNRLNQLTPDELVKKRDILYSKIFTNNNKEFKSLNKEEKNQLVDTLAFFENVELYFSPLKHYDFFNEYITQVETNKITPLVQSKALQDKGGRVDVDSFTGVYNKAELSQWFDSLDKAIKQNKPRYDFALSLNTDYHGIGLCYSAKTDRWNLIDANSLALSQQPFHYTQLSEITFLTFHNSINTTFQTTIATTKNHETNVRTVINHWKKEIEPLQKITPDKAKQYTERNTSLAYIATRAGDIETVKQLALNKAELNEVNTSGDALIHTAAIRGDDKILRVLIENKVALNKPNNNGMTPIHHAANYGHIKALQILIENKAELNKPDNHGLTLLHRAARAGHAKALQILIENKAELNKLDIKSPSPLHFAAKYGHAKALQILIENKAEPNKPDALGYTALDHAAKDGHAEVLQILIENNAEYGYFPIYDAAINQHVAALKILIPNMKNKAELNKHSHNGYTLAHTAAFKGDTELLQILIENKAELNKPSTDKSHHSPPVFFAADSGHTEIIRKFAENKADLNQINADGITPIYIAAQHGHVAAVRELLKYHADFKLSFPGSVDALVKHADSSGRKSQVESLIKDYNRELLPEKLPGFGPLHGAAFFGHLDVVQQLLKAGAPQQTTWGISAFEMAMAMNHHDIARVILQQYHPNADNFMKTLTDNINTQIPTRNKVLKHLHHFVLEHKKNKQDEYRQYMQEVNKLDDYTRELLLIKNQLKEPLPTQFVTIEKLIHDEYIAVANELEKKSVPLSNHQESLRNKMDVVKKTIASSTRSSNPLYNLYSFIRYRNNPVQQEKLIELIDGVNTRIFSKSDAKHRLS